MQVIIVFESPESKKVAGVVRSVSPEYIEFEKLNKHIAYSWNEFKATEMYKPQIQQILDSNYVFEDFVKYNNDRFYHKLEVCEVEFGTNI